MAPAQSNAQSPAPEPDPENPTEAQRLAYGDFAFLYMRSEFHRNVPLHLARLSIQPAIDLGFYKIFHIDDIPRYGVTWAFLSEATEAKLMRGEMLAPADWRSGNRMWVIEIIAPYGQGTAAAVVHWLKRSLPETISRVRYLRSDAGRNLTRIVEVNRIKGAHWGIRVLRPTERHADSGI